MATISLHISLNEAKKGQKSRKRKRSTHTDERDDMDPTRAKEVWSRSAAGESSRTASVGGRAGDTAGGMPEEGKGGAKAGNWLGRGRRGGRAARRVEIAEAGAPKTGADGRRGKREEDVAREGLTSERRASAPESTAESHATVTDDVRVTQPAGGSGVPSELVAEENAEASMEPPTCARAWAGAGAGAEAGAGAGA